MIKEYMAKITRIKAKDAPKSSPEPAGSAPKKKPAAKATKAKPAPKLDKKAQKAKNKAEKRAAKKAKKAAKKPMPKWLKILTWPFRILFKPFAALGRYIHDSWAEIRQVRWPGRKATWKSVLAVLIYAALIITFIALLDAFFTFIFNQLLGV